MSYDLMVFEPTAAPTDRDAFMAWYGEQTKWSEGHSYDDPAVTTAALRAWFMEIIETFAPMNGPLSDPDADDATVTDYSVGREVIYAAFAWSKAENAREVVFRLAAKHAVGFFDVSTDNGGVWLPGAPGELFLLHGG